MSDVWRLGTFDWPERLADEYTTAWAKLADELGYERDSRGIGLDQESALIRQANYVLDRFGFVLQQRFRSVNAVGLSIRYRGFRLYSDEPCLTFFVPRKLPRDVLGDEAIPEMFEGVPTDVVESGIPIPAGTQYGHQPGLKLRPIEPGCSISHSRVTSGTLACVVEDNANTRYLLSCAHVLSDAAGAQGEPIVQPGSKFGGTAWADAVATLTRCLQLNTGVSVADAGIAEITNHSLVNSAIRYVGAPPQGTRALTAGDIGLRLRKSGDETDLTSGYVVSVNATAGNHTANGVSNISFNDVIVMSGMSEGGDSGSLLIDAFGQAVGMLYGGLAVPAGPGQPLVTIASYFHPIDTVLGALGVHLP